MTRLPHYLLPAFLGVLLTPGLARGAKVPQSHPPDLVLSATRSWPVVLTATTAALRTAPEKDVPVILHEEGKERWTRHFVERYRPRTPLLLSVTSEGPEAPFDFLADAWGPGGVHLRGSVPDLLASLLDLALSDTSHPVPLVFVEASDYELALHAAVLAGRVGGLLVPVGDGALPRADAARLAATRASEIFLCGKAAESSVPGNLGPEVTVVRLEDIAAITRKSASLDAGGARKTPRLLVVTNPKDTEGYFSPPHLSLLAPLYAISRGGLLLTTGSDPDEILEAITAFEATHGPVTHITFVGDYLALGMKEMEDPDEVHQGRPNPRRFKVPPLAGLQALAPAEYATGRLAAEDVYDLSYQLGRIVAPTRSLGAGHSALVLANADLKFLTAELVAMASVKELENVGWEVDAFYGRSVDRRLIRNELPGKRLIVWHGHPRDLTVDYEIGVVDQRLDAALVVLQGCYTLDRSDPYVMVQQGAAAVVGTYMAVYSASGSAFAKALLDAMLYHGADAGEAMVHARNYLLAYVALKRKRGHRDWRKTWRAALSFDLWGDPTARPVDAPHPPSTPYVHLERDGDTLRFVVPPRPWGRLQVGRYELEPTPGSELGAIYTRKRSWGDRRRMQEMYFGWVDLPDFESEPRLSTSIPARDWVRVWSPRRRRLYLLVHDDAAERLGREGLVFRLTRS